MDDRNFYKCYNQPRHLSVSMDKFGFRYFWSLLTVVSCRGLMLYFQPPARIYLYFYGWQIHRLVWNKHGLFGHGIKVFSELPWSIMSALCKFIHCGVYSYMNISVQDCITVFTWDLHVIKGPFGTDFLVLKRITFTMVTPIVYTTLAFSRLKTETFENAADPVLVWKLQGCVSV